MKKLTLTLLSLCVSISLFGQSEDLERFVTKKPTANEKQKSPAQTPYLYLGPGMGINTYSGLIGGVFEVPIIPHLTAFFVVGSGGWGNKIGGGVMYYIRKDEYLGSAFGLGFANAFGLKDYPIDLYIEGFEEPQPTVLNLYNAPTLNISYQYHIRMGRTSKFVIGTGIAFATVDKPYELVLPENATLSSGSELTMKMLQPGGLMLSLTFQFGVGVR